MWNGLTVSELSEYLAGEIPQSTLYSDMNELEEIGAVWVESDGQPTGYRARFFQAEAENIDKVGESGLVGPQIIGLIGEAFTDDAVQKFVETYGHSMLNDALQVYIGSLLGDLNRSFVEMFPEVETDDLEAIVPAIERILLEMSRDPRWGIDYRDSLSTPDVVEE
ncbi:hypothetical protein C2R22_05690 [Salinigranum rubrum]|uniref:Uncharacterized protein n=2 Tax=Salinigranum rubrum TaxID=755307 RepID=A0A2I8VH11_9EURY|nr:hypothetical protein C2R22_05690 [Salinigranum rubrum]